MYAMLDQKKSSMNSKEEFIERNSKIYEGIEMSDLSITDITVKRQENGNAAVSYTTNMQTAAGNVEFTNDAVFSHDWTGYHLIWQDQLIFPELSATDKVQVTSEEAKRGDILDRNGRQLAGEVRRASGGRPANFVRFLCPLEAVYTTSTKNKSTIKIKQVDYLIKEDSPHGCHSLHAPYRPPRRFHH